MKTEPTPDTDSRELGPSTPDPSNSLESGSRVVDELAGLERRARLELQTRAAEEQNEITPMPALVDVEPSTALALIEVARRVERLPHELPVTGTGYCLIGGESPYAIVDRIDCPVCALGRLTEGRAE